MAFQQSFQSKPLALVPRDGDPESLYLDANQQPQQTSLYLDRACWTPDQSRAAAAVLGYEAGMLLRVIHGCADHGEEGLHAMGLLAVQLAREAAHYASHVLES